MLKLNKDQVKNILMEELDYSEGEADTYLSDYPSIHTELAEAVNVWLKERTVLNISLLGLSIQEVMEIQRCHFLMAIKYMDRLLDSDMSQEQKEKLVELLRSPVYIR
jgi:hypothetical protein